MRSISEFNIPHERGADSSFQTSSVDQPTEHMVVSFPSRPTVAGETSVVVSPHSVSPQQYPEKTASLGSITAKTPEDDDNSASHSVTAGADDESSGSSKQIVYPAQGEAKSTPAEQGEMRRGRGHRIADNKQDYDARRARVADAMRRGASLRTIAQEEGVSLRTVTNDLQAVKKASLRGALEGIDVPSGPVDPESDVGKAIEARIQERLAPFKQRYRDADEQERNATSVSAMREVATIRKGIRGDPDYVCLKDALYKMYEDKPLFTESKPIV